ncbi:hypothetical protein DPMN_154441 [Dreissena polymorpha]|uniref:Uncharacterized protein n=1 Tax=Dreissena polymorpha TaxID=45954 RepID=A0A9D4FL09_DREPO|nr:hypothetical protein DPMN_154441 [Dreissena polymorpha]
MVKAITQASEVQMLLAECIALISVLLLQKKPDLNFNLHKGLAGVQLRLKISTWLKYFTSLEAVPAPERTHSVRNHTM